jgi:hypothetical protein
MSRQEDACPAEEAKSTYMELLLGGEALPQQIDDFIDAWHDAPEGSSVSSQSLEEFLGMSLDEYRLWVEHPESLRFIAAARKANQPLEVTLAARHQLALAARTSDRSEAEKLLQWLIETGRINKSRPSW